MFKKILVILFTVFICSFTYADDHKYDFYYSQMPIVCGTQDAIEKYIKNKQFEPVGISLGRSNSEPNGEPVFMITFYANPMNESLITMDVPSGIEKCILFHTFNTASVPPKQPA